MRAHTHTSNRSGWSTSTVVVLLVVAERRLHIKQFPSSSPASFPTRSLPEPVVCLSLRYIIPHHPISPSPPPSLPHSLHPPPLCSNPLPTQAAVKVRQFYMVRLQCPCPISLWSEAGLNMPILILPNKLNHTGRDGGREGMGEDVDGVGREVKGEACCQAG